MLVGIGTRQASGVVVMTLDLFASIRWPSRMDLDMKTSRTLAITAVLSSLGLAAGLAQAAPAGEPGWYAGADVGRSEFKFDGGANFSDTAFAVHGGYRAARYFAVEASYADLGSFDYTLECPAGLACVPELYPQFVDVSAKRLDLALLGILPLGERFEAYAKVGFSQTEIDTHVVEGMSGTSDFSDRSSDAIYGVGVRMHFDAPWTLRLQWERVPDVDYFGVDVDALWLGAEYRFGG
jgi:hypothetical protein